MQQATVIKSTGSWYDILTDDDRRLKARIRGKFRLEGINLTNPVAVGDRVCFVIENEEENSAMIRQILPRKNYVVRQSPRKRHQLHLLASNIDQGMLVVTIVQPNIKPSVIDRFLLMTEPHNIPSLLVFNKSDLYSDQDYDLYSYLEAVYTSIGYSVFLTSGASHKGLNDVKEALRGKTTLVSGQSGVGKSTLINAMQPDLNLKTVEISDYSGKGQHTTTFAEMHALDDGFIIDTPGFKTLSFNNLEPMDVAHNFREFFLLSPKCKFHDCLHRNEPKCAVKAALEDGAVSELRYENYLRIMEEIEAQNYWERHEEL